MTCEVLGPDGRPAPRVIPAGTDLAIRIAHAAGDDVVRAVADRIARDLAQIGIAATAEGLPADRLAARSPDGVLAGRRFDVALVERRFGVVPGVGDLTCGAIPSAADGYAGANVGGWCDPELDALVRASRTAVDKAAAATAYGLAMRRAGESLPLLPLAPRSRLALAAPWVGRLALDPSATAITWNVEHWRIEGDRP